MVIRSITNLQHVQHFSHIARGKLNDCLDSTIVNIYILLLDYLIELGANVRISKWPEAEFRATRLNGWDDLVHMVANQTESRILCVFLDD
jgi:hypothetical protein